ncbi:peptidase S8 [Alishewanella sp. WH16-1]|jgi:serine protease AprX|uniref:S8 family peptidase n=1 Tax=Alishewanella sp. WH16-1 TaxID=1651088 RepID=UPI00070BA04C|nr:S8 family serine peptidase [Alishewanella sp. WH16-1]KRS21649.1 peptidase S8 [Alishewanella sp. WH16-1]
MLYRKLTNTLLTVALAGFSLSSAAQAVIGSQLTEKLQTLPAAEQLMVVVTFDQLDPLSTDQVQRLMDLGITQGVQFKSLPMIGVLVNAAQINQISTMPDVRSVFLNRQLQYFNAEARELTGVERVQSQAYRDRNGLTYTGKGVTVLVHDSGIDATLDDLAYGTKVVQNAQALTHAQALRLTGVSGTWIENQLNTDLNSGHGTHVAGTVAGFGSHSDGKYKGAAVHADLVGYGSGGGIAILDALGGFDYAITRMFDFRSPIRVITNSWGSSGKFEPDNPINVASYKAYKLGILTVFAAGNSGPGEDTHNPYAQIPWGISVGAGTKSGDLIGFSSRGSRFETGDFTMPDGSAWTYRNEVTVVAPGVDIISSRAKTNLAANGGAADVGVIESEYLPFYTMISGTSMATPHVSGIIAMMLEANPNLQPLDVKRILQETATNMPGYEAFEVGAGYVNAHAAIAAALGEKEGYRATVNSINTFNANALIRPAGDELPFELFFSPIGETEEFSFEVAEGVTRILASARPLANTVKLKLTSPTGEVYFGSLSTPVLSNVTKVSAPAVPGTWKLSIFGLTSLAGVTPDPLGVTNGPGAPEFVSGAISFLASDGYTGLNDIQGHPAENAIQYAVSERLLDSFNSKVFRPDHALKRGDLAKYLVMGAAVRQYRPHLNEPVVNTSDKIADAIRPFVDAVLATGGALKDRQQQQSAVLPLQNGKFNDAGSVTRDVLAYAMVQSLGLEQQARSFTGNLTVDYRGQRVPVRDSAQIPAAMRGHVQLALELSLMNVRFAVEQGPFDLEPKLAAYFEPNREVKRAEYAVSAGALSDYYL